MYHIILFIHCIIAVALIGLVLIQHGKGAQIGAAFGSGASQTVFGSQGSGSFLLKVTGALAAGFFATSITLSYLAASTAKQANMMPLTTVRQQQSAPANQAPAPNPAPTNSSSGQR